MGLCTALYALLATAVLAVAQAAHSGPPPVANLEGTGHFEFPALDLGAGTASVSGHFNIDTGTHLNGGDILSLPGGLHLLIRLGGLLMGLF